jgi:hypothetical protein
VRFATAARASRDRIDAAAAEQLRPTVRHVAPQLGARAGVLLSECMGVCTHGWATSWVQAVAVQRLEHVGAAHRLANVTAATG